ncbi:hypothetical protein ALI22I_01375 [Saccharothrix sp. ALI-22-I]|nr:hypothetical protein ALI22I_01375 [Saccharothrix sp. ALI-22-I]
MGVAESRESAIESARAYPEMIIGYGTCASLWINVNGLAVSSADLDCDGFYRCDQGFGGLMMGHLRAVALKLLSGDCGEILLSLFL